MKLLIMLAVAGILFVLQRWLYSRYWDQGLSVSIRFQDKAVLEGEEARMTEVIENRKLLPLIYLNVKFQISRNLVFSTMENTSVSDYNYKSDVFSVLFHQRITRHLTFRCQKRGYYEINQTDLISSDLLMSRDLAIHTPQKTFLYVYPRHVDVSALEAPFRRMIGTVITRQFLIEDPFAFRGIRDYTLTDPMNHINWKASARTGGLMVNQYDSTSSQEAIILLNLETETVWVYEQLHEVAIRLAAAVSAYFLRASIPTRMVCNGSDCLTDEVAVIPSGSGILQVSAIAEVLSRVDLTRRVIPCVDQIRELRETPLPGNPLFIMISNNMSREIQQEFAALTAGRPALWLCPLYDDMEMKIAPAPGLEAIRWEVDRYAD